MNPSAKKKKNKNGLPNTYGKTLPPKRWARNGV